jgi:large subunit ribosomal protein L33
LKFPFSFDTLSPFEKVLSIFAFVRGSTYEVLRGTKMAKKSGRIIITLECTEARAEGKPVSRYTTTKNKTKTPGRLEKKKYNPNLKKHTVHRETK